MLVSDSHTVTRAGRTQRRAAGVNLALPEGKYTQNACTLSKTGVGWYRRAGLVRRTGLPHAWQPCRLSCGQAGREIGTGPAVRICIESTIVSYVAARPSRDLIRAARQELTREWWEERSGEHDL